MRGRVLDVLMNALPEEKSSKRVEAPVEGERTRGRRNSAKFSTVDLGAFAGRTISPTKSNDEPFRPDRHSA